MTIDESEEISTLLLPTGDSLLCRIAPDPEEAVPLIPTASSSIHPHSNDERKLLFFAFVAFLCACVNGYDSSLMTGINGMQPFLDRFTGGKTLGEGTGILFSIYNIGAFPASFLAAPLADKYGRRSGMFWGGFIICLGTAVISTSARVPQFLLGRFILGFGVSFLLCAAPSYIVEVAPPGSRGRFTAFYNCGWFGGAIPSSIVVLAASKLNSDWAWRIPLILQAIPALFIMAAVRFLPESPRWLFANGRDQEALDFLARYHGGGRKGDPIVRQEWKEFKANIRQDASDKRWWDYSELFSSGASRKRIRLVLLMAVFGQFSGNGLGYFALSIFESVGYSTRMQFSLNVFNQFISAAGAFLGMALSDRMPRRKALVFGTIVVAFMLCITGSLSKLWVENANTGTVDPRVGQGAVVGYFSFWFVFSFIYTPLQALYPVECLDTPTRAKGMAVAGFVGGVLGFINTFGSPIALKYMRYNYIFFFVGWDLFEAAVWYKYAVETHRWTLEELAQVFESPDPIKASLRRR